MNNSRRTKKSKSRSRPTPRVRPYYVGHPSLASFQALPTALRVLPSTDEMRAIDQAAIQSGIPSLELMERAGKAVAELGHAHLKKTRAPVVVLCGPGNNGGDGMVCARYLARMGHMVQVVVAEAERYSPDCLTQLTTLKNLRSKLIALMRLGEMVGASSLSALPEVVASLSKISEVELESMLVDAPLVVDALLGIGHKGEPRPTIASAIECINSARRKNTAQIVLALDIPSGVNASEGGTSEPTVRADLTVAIELVKRGMLQHPAIEELGNLIIVPIGMAEPALQQLTQVPFYAVCADDLPLRVPPRVRNTHKGFFRRVLVVGGDESMPGAPLLAGHAALRSGVPLVTVTTVRGSAVVDSPPELMRMPFSENPGPRWSDSILKWLEEQQGVLALGPGLGSTAEAATLVRTLLHARVVHDHPLVIDADALNLLAQLLTQGEKFSLPQAVLTPHPGEMARLLGMSVPEVQARRYEAATALAQKLHSTVILKGASSIIASYAPVGSALRGAVNLTGTPWLATGGSGDVLTGVVAAFLAHGKPPFEAACAATMIHGAAGEYAHAALGGPIIASDIIAAFPSALSMLTASSTHI